MIWEDLTWYDMIWYDMIWFDIQWYTVISDNIYIYRYICIHTYMSIYTNTLMDVISLGSHFGRILPFLSKGSWCRILAILKLPARKTRWWWMLIVSCFPAIKKDGTTRNTSILIILLKSWLNMQNVCVYVLDTGNKSKPKLGHVMISSLSHSILLVGWVFRGSFCKLLKRIVVQNLTLFFCFFDNSWTYFP